ncbi:hypothetical protein BG004_002905 [Podila humilis]|nr:hypothetical protein BG004_002905 [Podila humilis]
MSFVRYRPGSDDSKWTDIVQGLTTPIHSTQDLAAVLARWNEGDPNGWSLNALEIFLDSRTAAASSLAAAAVSQGETSSSTELLFSSQTSDDDGDMKMDTRDENNFYHSEELVDVQCLSPTERDRFFRVLLPRMQELALRLPELVKKPIPFLKQQEDSAVTLSQEQIACLLANAFFCTYPCRNAPNLLRRPERRKRFNTDDHEPQERIKYFTAGGQTLNSTPNDPHGVTTAKQHAPKGGRDPASNAKPDPTQPKDPFNNANGQTSLFAYFNKQEPTAKKSMALGQTTIGATPRPAVTPREVPRSQQPSTERQQVTSNDDGDGRERHERQTAPFPRYPSINLSSLFYSEEGVCTSTNAAKLRCLLHYFDRVTTHMPQGAVTFHRQVLRTPVTRSSIEQVTAKPFRYAKVKVEPDSPLEDDAPLGALQLDFANKVIGGGVLGRGAVQEEIRFAICPELIISRLFTQQLQKNESLLIKGAERYSNYNGYARTFEWHSDHVDTTPRDCLGRRQTEICAIDALPFKLKEQRLDQFGEDYLLREFNKAIAGFRTSPITNSEWGMLRPEETDKSKSSRPEAASLIATGNWGCGAFGGHLQLKFLIQWMAASICESFASDETKRTAHQGRDLIYYTYGLDELAHEIQEFSKAMEDIERLYEPEHILEYILQYPIKSTKGAIVALPKSKTLLEYIGDAIGMPSSKPDPLESASSDWEYTPSLPFSTFEVTPDSPRASAYFDE